MALRIEARTFRLVERALALAGLLRRVARDTWSLAKLEAERARASLVSVAILGFAAALLAVTAWLLLVFGLVTWIVDRWLDLPSTLLLVALVMIGGVASIVMAIKRQLQNLKFTATRRQLEALRHGD
jgi:O-antigen/teichoic acid export membrane protein